MKNFGAFLLLLPALGSPRRAAAQIAPVSAAPAAAVSPAPDSLWKKSFNAALNFQEATLSSNWRGGGVNSFGLNALLNAQADYRRGIHSWDNEADFLYAFVANKGQGYRKSLDRLFLDTKYGRALNPKWDMFVSLNLLTQFAAGYKYTDDGGQQRAEFISSTFAPAFVTAAYGLEYHPTTYFKVRFSPFAPRLTVVGRNERFRAALGDTPYGVRPGHATRWEVLAAQILAEFDRDIAPNVNLKARYLLFANYGGDNLALRRIDHRLDAGLTAKVNRHVNAALTGILLYDYDQDRGVQYSQGLTLGVIYQVQNYKAK